MLARYQIIRGKRQAGRSLPKGIRKDTRKHQRHCFSPEREIVEVYLRNPTSQAWYRFKTGYLKLIEKRFRSSRRSEFDKVASLAMRQDYYIGCSCPTKKNPDVYKCHTVLALRLMKDKYPILKVTFPETN